MNGILCLRLSRTDAAWAVVMIVFTAAAASVWWLSRIVPGQDYPQFLVFVRAMQDIHDPSSPFHGTYETGPWLMPTVLPLVLTSFFSHLFGGSIEDAGKLLMTLQSVGCVAASAYLLRTLERSRWAIVLLFGIIHSAWTVVGGFVAFATALPLVVLGWALTVRWLRVLDARSGIALTACLCATMLWHGIAYAQLGLGFAILFSLWRAPSLRARIVAAVPTLPSLVGFTLASSALVAQPQRGSSLSWRSPSQALGSFLGDTWATLPHSSVIASLLAILVVAGFAASTRDGPRGQPSMDIWRVGNPFLIVTAVYLVAAFALPMNVGRVEGVSNRFSYVALLALVFAWNVPRARVARSVLLVGVLVFDAWSLGDVAHRFSAFDDETRGASVLIDRIPPRATLFACSYPLGASSAFGMPNKAMLEIEQYATIRGGGLPNSSFAGYGVNFVRYVDGHNPMPGLHCPYRVQPAIARFDYVLTLVASTPSDERLRLVGSEEGWNLYRVCGGDHSSPCNAEDAPVKTL